MKSILTTLTNTQRDAATHSCSPLFIVAGPGSGKTRVLAHRIVHLVQEVGVDPTNILGVTFTRKAAREMRTRVSSLLGRGYVAPAIHTFHALCLRILRAHASHLKLASNFTINSPEQQRLLVSQVIRDLRLNPSHFPTEDVWKPLPCSEVHPELLDMFAKDPRYRVLSSCQTGGLPRSWGFPLGT